MKEYKPMKLNDGTTMITIGMLNFRVPANIAEKVCMAMSAAHNEGMCDAKADLRAALGVDDALDYLERSINQNITG